MSNRLIRCGIVVLVLGLASSLYAGGIINKQNLSADYIRTLNRNAAYDSADATVYNPAGVMRMEKGLYVRADAIYFAKDYSNAGVSIPALGPAGNFGTLDANDPSIIPGLFALYKQDKWAGFFAATIPGGGGKVEYEKGNARTAVLGANFAALIGVPFSHSIEAESVYKAYTFGAAYKISDMLSMAGGVRYVDAYQKFKGYARGALGEVNVDIKRTDASWNYFLGLNYAPIKDLNIGLLYMANTPLDFKSEAKDSSPGAAISKSVGWANGTYEREDLPGYVALGVSYFIIPDKLRVETDLTYYLEKQASFAGSRFKNVGNSYDLGLMLEYTINPQWKMSVGYLNTNIRGMQPDDLLPEAPETDANTLALGVVWSPLERLSLTLGGSKVWYDSQTKEITNSRGPAGAELNKDVWGLSFGVQYRFF
jgi:long-chain fatty acid transport protein